MLDIRMIRERASEVQKAADRRGIPCDVAELLDIDERYRQQRVRVEAMRAERNARSARIAALIRDGRETEGATEKREAAELAASMAQAEAELKQLELELDRRLLAVPNWISPDTPDGGTDEDNVEIRRWGEPQETDFPLLSHVELGEKLGMFDLRRGVKVGGSRHYVLKGAGFMLHRAVQQLALDLLGDEGFTLLDVPVMAKEEAMTATGFFPAGRDQAFELEGGGRFLAGTAEVPLVAMHAGETIDLTEPLRLAAATPCFRSEVGKAGKDVHGLYRVHQFAKVEQVIICRADSALADQWLERILSHAEKLLRLLELPYRVVAVCTGDLSYKNYKQFDLETWMPSRHAYGETHSASNLLDFQARRAGIRYRDEGGQLRFAYTLNNTMAATPRILIPLMENHQEADGSIRVPEALRPYMRGMEEIRLPV
ncbi:serine--tRNA ligase [Paenibacillus methanolicus]|uniref:Serine--tRNA ligase n=1 Tax=Paenibacillus methanolicus TaxID=582686 RepID=A0A5S5C209_9BACL|nr:serine--tRNA ligase [Paenibacillus methanolicus]TYP72502.1 seryl-tRNA synthetase [Paenibacillus methanolicus]